MAVVAGRSVDALGRRSRLSQGCEPLWFEASDDGNDTFFGPAVDAPCEHALRARPSMGSIRIRDDIHCRTVPVRELDGDIDVDLTGEETTVLLPFEMTVERREE